MSENKEAELVLEIYNITVERMKTLGVYREEYKGLIHIYAQLCQQYAVLTERFEKSKYRVRTSSAQGGYKKDPIVAALETLRKDILAYSDRLCLNPKSFDQMNLKPQGKQSKLAATLEGLDDC